MSIAVFLLFITGLSLATWFLVKSFFVPVEKVNDVAKGGGEEKQKEQQQLSKVAVEKPVETNQKMVGPEVPPPPPPPMPPPPSIQSTTPLPSYMRGAGWSPYLRKSVLKNHGSVLAEIKEGKFKLKKVPKEKKTGLRR
jgi:hypothetical protein